MADIDDVEWLADRAGLRAGAAGREAWLRAGMDIIHAARKDGQQRALQAIKDCIDLIEGWAYGPLFAEAGVKWDEGRCKAPALLQAKFIVASIEGVPYGR